MLKRLKAWLADRADRKAYAQFQRGYDYARQGLRAGTAIEQLEAEADTSSAFNEGAMARAFDRGMQAALHDHEEARRRFRALRDEGRTPAGRAMQNVLRPMHQYPAPAPEPERRDVVHSYSVTPSWPSGLEASNDVAPEPYRSGGGGDYGGGGATGSWDSGSSSNDSGSCSSSDSSSSSSSDSGSCSSSD